MGWALGEGPAQAARTFISLNAAAKLAAVEARHADGVTLPTFAAIRISDPMAEAEAEFPTLYVVPERDQPVQGYEGIGGWQTGFYLQTDLLFVVVYELSVDLSSTGVTEAEVVRKQGLRYAVALLEILAVAYATTGYQFGTGSGWTIEYGETFTRSDRNSQVSSVYLRIGVASVEEAL